MNEKLNIQNLIDLFVQKQGASQKEAEEFVRAFFSLIEEGLERDRYVKIKRWGTFKLIGINSRESVDVNTGERIEIQSHTKVSFTPDSSLKDVINRPFAHFETVILNENTVLEDTLVGGENEIDSETDMVVEEESPAEKTEKIKEEELPSLVLGTESIETQPKDINEPEKENKPIEIEERIRQEVGEGVDRPEEKNEPKEEEVVLSVSEDAPYDFSSEEPFPVPRDNTMKYFITLAVLIMAICGGAIFFIYNPDFFARPIPPPEEPKHIVDSSEPLMPSIDSLLFKFDSLRRDSLRRDSLQGDSLRADTLRKLLQTSPEELLITGSVKKEEQIKKEMDKLLRKPQKGRKQDATGASQAFTTDSTSYEIVGTETNHTIAAGETLTRVALKYYGTKALWPYLVQHNPDVIKNPDNVPSGTVIKIPKLRKRI